MRLFNSPGRPLRIKLPLKDKIVLFFSPVAVLVIAIVLYMSINQYREELISNAKTIMAQTTENEANHFTSYVKTKLDILQSLAKFDEIKSMDDEVINEFLSDQIDEFGFINIFLVDTRGNYYYPHKNLTVYKPLGHASEDDLWSHISKTDIFLSEPYYEDDISYMTLCTAIYNDSDEKVGTLCGKISVEDIESVIERNETILDSICFMVDSEGRNISSTMHSEFFKYTTLGSDDTNYASVVDKAFEQKSDSTGIITLLGEDYYAYVKYMYIFDWSIVMCIDLNMLDETVNFLAFQQYAMIALLFILLFAIIRIIRSWQKSDREINTDSLCNCGSRAACTKMIEYLDSNRNRSVYVLYADLNHFKYANDTFGHDVGDRLLKIFSNTLTTVFSKYGFVGRMGGDEFIVFIDGRDLDFVEELWAKVTTLLDKESDKLDFDYRISAAHGIALRSAGAVKSIRDVMNEADNAMYIEKKLQK